MRTIRGALHRHVKTAKVSPRNIVPYSSGSPLPPQSPSADRGCTHAHALLSPCSHYSTLRRYLREVAASTLRDHRIHVMKRANKTEHELFLIEASLGRTPGAPWPNRSRRLNLTMRLDGTLVHKIAGSSSSHVKRCCGEPWCRRKFEVDQQPYWQASSWGLLRESNGQQLSLIVMARTDPTSVGSDFLRPVLNPYSSELVSGCMQSAPGTFFFSWRLHSNSQTIMSFYPHLSSNTRYLERVRSQGHVLHGAARFGGGTAETIVM